MTAPKPMDPDRLADLRDCLAGCDDPTMGFPLQSFARELLADRDHHAYEAERIRAQWRKLYAQTEAHAQALRALARAVIDGDGMSAKVLAADVLDADERGEL